LAPVAIAYLVASSAFFADEMVAERDTPSTTLGGVTGPAAGAGLRAGDTIVSIDDVPVRNWDDVPRAIRSKKEPVTITFKREGSVESRLLQPNEEGRVGLVSGVQNDKPPVGTALTDALARPASLLFTVLAPRSGGGKVHVFGLTNMRSAAWRSFMMVGFLVTMTLPAFGFAPLFERWLRRGLRGA
jgi:membrane-associated protease RseP (regulator of RpoE activity)